MSLLIRNAHMIDSDQSINERKDILVEDGKIKTIAAPKTISTTGVDKIVDATDCYVTSGFVDLHVHFREPGQEHKEDIESGSKSAVAGGFTSVLCMPNTYPVNDSVEVTRLMIDKAKKVDLCRVYPVGAVTKSLMSKEIAPIKDLYKAGCIAFSDDGRPVSNIEVLKKALHEIRELNSVMIEHCEELPLSKYVTIHDGAVSKEMGLQGIPLEAETVDVMRLILLAKETGCHVHLAHLSCEDSVKFLQMFRANMKLTAEVAPHHLVLTHEDIRKLGTNGKMYPPLRRQQDCDMLIEGLDKGWVDAVATDHAPHAANEKGLPFEKAPNGVIGLETAFPVMMRLVHEGKIKFENAIAAMSTKPAKIVGLQTGLKVGNQADMVVFSLNEVRDFSKENFSSKSNNHPFANYPGRGRIHQTIVGGQVKFTDGAL
jgi:dihydroorotase